MFHVTVGALVKVRLDVFESMKHLCIGSAPPTGYVTDVLSRWPNDPYEDELIVLFKDIERDAEEVWSIFDVEVLRPTRPASKGWFPMVDELIDSLVGTK